jgi:hypothetical protein
MELVIAGLMILTLANPILLVWIWLTGVAKRRSEYPQWRTFLVWIGLVAVTLAELVFWVSNIYAPTVYSQREVYFYRFTCISIIAAAVAFALAVMGSGSRRGWIALSAVMVPLSWLASVMVE